MRFLPFLLFCRLVASDCIQVSGDQIRTGDLARAVPQFAAIHADAFVGYAPAPGIQRVIAGAELRRIAGRYGLQGDIREDVCFQLETEILTEERVNAALREAVGDDRISIELLEFSRYPVPKGTLDFPRSGLTHTASESPDVPVIWKGFVRKLAQRTVSVWARVKLSVEAERTVAVSPLPPGRPITQDQVRTEAFRAFPFDGHVLANSADIVGRVSRTSVRAGQAITRLLVTTKADINRGETVQITVISGTARVSFSARAETSGSAGQLVTIRNPWNKQQFRATVEAPGRAKVDVRQ